MLTIQSMLGLPEYVDIQLGDADRCRCEVSVSSLVPVEVEFQMRFFLSLLGGIVEIERGARQNLPNRVIDIENLFLDSD